MQCKRCGSYAVNEHLHGRTEGRLSDRCDVCYWRETAEELLNALEAFYALVRGECPSVLEDDHHDEIVRAAIAKAKGE